MIAGWWDAGMLGWTGDLFFKARAMRRTIFGADKFTVGSDGVHTVKAPVLGDLVGSLKARIEGAFEEIGFGAKVFAKPR